MSEWWSNNYEWLFGGVGVSMLSGFWLWIRNLFPFNLRGSTQSEATEPPRTAPQQAPRVAPVATGDVKQRTRILFIDDDTTFKVVKIIKAAGWPHIRIVKDVKGLECAEIQEATILFVDVQGVGRALGFSNEGLGLALAIKKKFPAKKVVIYSAQTSGDRFDEALRKADDFLPKNADPYEFLALVDRLSTEA